MMPIIASDITLANIESWLSTVMNREAVVERLFKDVQINPGMQASAKDAKTALQEWLQGRKLKLPVYKVVATTGAAHTSSTSSDPDSSTDTASTTPCHVPTDTPRWRTFCDWRS